jgi:muconate cycloisomerase
MSNIAHIRTYHVENRVRPELAMVSAVGKHQISRYILVGVEDTDGRVGWGEATVMPRWSGETPEGTAVLIEKYFAPILSGLSLEEAAEEEPLQRVTPLLTALDQVAIGNYFAKASLEMAVWDLIGQTEGVPIHALLYPGVSPRSIPIRGSIAAVEPEEAAARARWFLSHGLRAVKVKVGMGYAQDVPRVRAVREMIGPAIPMGIDANAGWSVEEAVQCVRALEDCHLQYVEQPVARGDFVGLRAVKEQIGVPVMADELVWTMQEVETVLQLDAADIISIYPGKMGGIAPCIRIARRVAEAGKQVYIGSNLEFDIGTAAMAHLAVGLPGADLAHLFSDLVGTLFHEQSIGEPALCPINGEIHPPTGTGLGVKPRSEVLP